MADEQVPPSKQVDIKPVLDAEARLKYSDVVHVQITPFDMRLYFLQTVVPIGVDLANTNQMEARPVAQIVLNFGAAESLAAGMQDAIARVRAMANKD